jgi:hypothetical protein
MPRTQMETARPRSKLNLANPHTNLFPSGNERSLIQWPTWEEIQQVSDQLARIQRAGIRSEADGDYFKSGDLAYQIQEIIRATAELCRKSERAKR